MKNHDLDCTSLISPSPVSMCERLLYLVGVCVCVFVVSVCQYALSIKMKTFAMESSVNAHQESGAELVRE